MGGVESCREEIHRYKIWIQGTGIERYYEFENHIPTEKVKETYWQDVRDNWNEKLANVFKKRIKVKNLCRKTTDTSSETKPKKATGQSQLPEGEAEGMERRGQSG